MSDPINFPVTTILLFPPPIIDLSLSSGATTSGFPAFVPTPSPIRAVVGQVTRPPSAKGVAPEVTPINDPRFVFNDEILKAAAPPPIIIFIRLITAN